MRRQILRFKEFDVSVLYSMILLILDYWLRINFVDKILKLELQTYIFVFLNECKSKILRRDAAVQI